MATASDKAAPTQNTEDDLSPSEKKTIENGEAKVTKITAATKTNGEEKKERTEEEASEKTDSHSTSNESVETTTKKTHAQEDNTDSKQQQHQKSTSSKSRSVNFASTLVVNNDEVPRTHAKDSADTYSYYTSSRTHRPIDFIDTLVESYKLETNNTSPVREEFKYVPKTNRSRLNPNWREHRTRHLMNKLEELSLWDREEELKAQQAQFLREQKWEQILDRQRNHDLCLTLMRQRHESEMESAVKLDRAATGVNDENTNATIANTIGIASTSNIIAFDLPVPPQSLKRRVRQDEEKTVELKTPIGRYRQFEKVMSAKQDKINQKLQPDREIMNAYNPCHTSIPPTSVPLFSETYSALISVPDAKSMTSKYNQYHYGVASYLHQPQHAPSPDYEIRLRSYAGRDVRVPLKEQISDNNYYDEDNVDEQNRSNSIERDHYKKYRTSSTDDGYYSKHRSNPIDEDYNAKYRLKSIDDDYNPKYRSKAIDRDYNPRYRAKLRDEDYDSKYRSKSIEDDYDPKYRLKFTDEDYNPKSRSKPIDDDFDPKYRSKFIDTDEDENYPNYRTSPADDNYYSKYHSKLAATLDYSPPRRTTSLASPTASSLYDFTTVANTPREYSLIHSRQPASTSIHLRSLNDDLNAITGFSNETSKRILKNVGDSFNDSVAKSRSSLSTKKYNSYNTDQDFHDENVSFNSSQNHSSKIMQQPIEILSLSSTK